MSTIFGFIGTGNMGGAIAQAVVKTLPPTQVLLTDKNTAAAEQLAQTLGCVATALTQVVATCDYIFLGVKPHIFPHVLADIAPLLQERSTPPVLISMAAGVKLCQIEAHLPLPCPLIRIMPNTPVALGCGMILYAHNALTSQAQVLGFQEALAQAGKLLALEESLIDAGSAVSGCGPAFVYLFIDALADGGVAAGLSRADALHLATQTVMGAAQMVAEGNKHPEQLKNEVCSPGGSTIQGVRRLEQGAFRATCMDAVLDAFAKTVDLGRQS